MSEGTKTLDQHFRVTLYFLDNEYPAYTDGTRWNGWATPHFSESTVEELIEDFNA